MDKTAKAIIEVLEKRKNIKAKEIAKILGIEKKEVNHYLYSDLRDICVQNDNYEWNLKSPIGKANVSKGKEEIVKHEKIMAPMKENVEKSLCKDDYTIGDSKVNDKTEKPYISQSEHESINEHIEQLNITDPLQKLCRYYIDCILLEQETGIELYADSKFELNYRCINKWPVKGQSYSDDANELIQKIMTSNSVSGYFGYPVLVKRVGQYKKINPIFLWEIDRETGKVDFSSIPVINPNIIKHYVVKSSEAVVKELVQLEKELGIYDALNIESIDSLINRLVEARQWQWNDQFNTCSLNPISFSEIEREGIYNKAIIVSANKSPYTKGLISELQTLSEMTISDCKGTALYDWITGGVSEEHTSLQKEVLEVLPLNNEQKKSIEKALTGALTVITGPPGTGKSQVVINLLMNQIYNGKSVLFSSKNNKAVEVIIKRANELTKMPFVVQLGGTAGNSELSDALGKILNADNITINEEGFKDKENVYNKYRSIINSLEANIDKVVLSRNELDDLEHSLEKFRKRYDAYFKMQTPINIERIKGEWTEFLEKRRLLFKENNSFIDRVRWKSIAPQKESDAFNCMKRIEKYLSEIDVLIPQSIEQIQSMCIDQVNENFNEYIEMLGKINSYVHNKKILINSESIEELERKCIATKQRFYQIAKEYWDVWLSKNRTALEPKDKRNIIEYLNGLKLLSGDAEDESIPQEIKNMFKKIQRVIPKYINAQAVTLLSAKGRVPLAAGTFDMLVIDEASQCDIASAIPLLYRAKTAVIIGDMNQLSHVSTLPKRRDQELLRKYNLEDFSWLYSVSSLFALAQSRASGNNVVKLKEHFRSHADIIEFSNKEFYGGDLVTATKYNELKLPPKEKPGVRWIDVDGVSKKPPKGSLINEMEAEAVVKELQRLNNIGYLGTIGVISPFRAQADLIKKLLEKDPELFSCLITKNNLEINTVHQFQGDERDTIIFSTTISQGTKDSSKFFLKENGNLFNVAITRAKAILIVVGNKEYCRNCGVQYLEHFAKYVEEKEGDTELLEYDIVPTATYPKVSNMHQVSDWEVYFYKKLYQAGIITLPQYPVDKYKLDLALVVNGKKLDIEVDGEMYHKNWDGELCYRDQLRNQRMFELGWDVKRFWVYQIRDDIDGCVNAIKAWINENAVNC